MDRLSIHDKGKLAARYKIPMYIGVYTIVVRICPIFLSVITEIFN